jgi:hypothetical protein
MCMHVTDQKVLSSDYVSSSRWSGLLWDGWEALSCALAPGVWIALLVGLDRLLLLSAVRL